VVESMDRNLQQVVIKWWARLAAEIDKFLAAPR
jgi:hypothetical protein